MRSFYIVATAAAVVAIVSLNQFAMYGLFFFVHKMAHTFLSLLLSSLFYLHVSLPHGACGLTHSLTIAAAG